MSSPQLIAAAVLTGVVISGVILFVWWCALVTVYRPLMLTDNAVDVLVLAELSLFWQTLFAALFSIPFIIANGVFGVLTKLRSNIALIAAYLVMASFALVWLEYHNTILVNYVILRQCVTRPILDFFLMPLFTCICMVYDTVIAVVNFWVNLEAFYWFGLPLVLFKCAVAEPEDVAIDIGNVMFYFSNIFRAWMQDLKNWWSADPIYDEWTVLNSAAAFGLFMNALIPVQSCVCAAVQPLYVAIDLFSNLPSLQQFINCLWNFFVRVVQLVMATLMNFFVDPSMFPRPDVTNITLEACCAVLAAGDVAEDTVFILMEMLFALGNNSALPFKLHQFLSLHWAEIITQPVCGGLMTANITVTMFFNIDYVELFGGVCQNTTGVFSADGTGVRFFQFGAVFDTLKLAALALANTLYILDPQAQALANELLDLGIDLGTALLGVLSSVPIVGQLAGVSAAGAVILGKVTSLPFIPPLAQLIVVPLTVGELGMEYLVGAIFYFLYGGPLQPHYPNAPYNNCTLSGLSFVGDLESVLLIYNPNYWLKENTTVGNYTYTTALATTIQDLFLLCQAIGDIVALINDQLGCVTEHTLKVFAAAVEVLANYILFFFTIITFQPDLAVSLQGVNFDVIFNELFYLASCLGNLIRQFDSNNCQHTPSFGEDNLVCCLGGLITTALDTLIIAAQQITRFVQDVISFPTGQLDLCVFGIIIGPMLGNETLCIRIPNFATAIYELQAAVCLFTCAAANFLPILSFFNALQCAFPPPPPPQTNTPPEVPKPCGSITTCLSYFFCQVLLFPILPVQLLNAFFTQVVSGTFYNGIFAFLQTAVTLVVTQAGNVIDAYGIILDCMTCFLVGKGHDNPPDCDTIFYDTLHPLVELIQGLISIFTMLFLTILKLILQLLVGLFSGNPIKAIVAFIVNFFVQVLGGLGSVVVKFLVNLLDSMGLGFLGSVIEAIYKGLCPILQTVVNIIITILKEITFGLVQITYANFCCSGAPNCTPSGGVNKRDEEGGVVEGTILTVTPDNWLNAVVTRWNHSFPATSGCNASITAYHQVNWTSLDRYQQGEVWYCFMQGFYWQMRTDNQSVMMNSTCDAMIMESGDWGNMSLLEKLTIMECTQSRFYVDAARAGTNWSWFPQDWLTNPYRKYQFGLELARGYLIYWQFYSDRSVTSTSVLSATYQENWARLGLNVSFYQNLSTPNDVLLMRTQYHLDDYFNWNNATQYPAVVTTSTGFWSLCSFLIEALQNVTTSFSNVNMTDASQYITFDYTLNNPTSGATASLNDIFVLLLQGWDQTALYWSNPNNLKKRGEAYVRVKDTARSVYEMGMDQLRLMSAEWLDEKAAESQCYADEASGGDTCELLHEYNRAARGKDRLHGNRSWAYQLGQWWPRFKAGTLSLRVYPIIGRDGRNRTSAWRKEASEPILTRFIDYYSRVVEGTPQSRARIAKLWYVVERVRDGLFGTIVRRTMAKYSDRQPPINNPPPAPAPLTDTELRSRFDHKLEENLLPGQRLYDMKTIRRGGESLLQASHPCDVEHEDCVIDQEDSTALELEARYTAWASTHDEEGGVRGAGIYSAQRTTSRQSRFTNAVFRAAGMATLQSFLDLNCTSNITYLCTNCFYLDQLVTRVVDAADILLGYYFNGQYNASLNQQYFNFNYVMDPTAVVLFGSGPMVLPPFPSNQFSNFEWINDNTPNKLYFNDIIAMFNNFSNSSNASYANSSLVTSVDYTTINGQIFGFVSLITSYFLELGYDIVLYIFSNPADAGADTANAGLFLINWFIICDWDTGDDYLGTKKRFSIGESMLMYLVGFYVTGFVLYMTVQVNLLDIITGTALSFMIWLFSFLAITYNYGCLCWPGLPVMLMDDINYFLTYTLLAKCMWFWSFLVTTPYDNTNCYACSSVETIQMANCVHDGHFVDIFANLVFMLQYYEPSWLQWLRDTTTPLFIFYQIPFINMRVNAFANVNFADPHAFAFNMGCNYIVTLPWDIMLFSFWLLLADMALPLITASLAALILLFEVVFYGLFLLYYILQSFFITITMMTFAVTGHVDHLTPEQLVNHPVTPNAPVVDSDGPYRRRRGAPYMQATYPVAANGFSLNAFADNWGRISRRVFGAAKEGRSHVKQD